MPGAQGQACLHEPLNHESTTQLHAAAFHPLHRPHLLEKNSGETRARSLVRAALHRGGAAAGPGGAKTIHFQFLAEEYRVELPRIASIKKQQQCKVRGLSARCRPRSGRCELASSSALATGLPSVPPPCPSARSLAKLLLLRSGRARTFPPTAFEMIC